MARSVVETPEKLVIIDQEPQIEVVLSYRGPQGPPGDGIETFNTIAALEAVDDPENIAYVTETATFYEYLTNISRSVDHLRFLSSTSTGIWVGVSGPYSAIIPLFDEDGTAILSNEGLLIYTLYKEV